MRIHDEARIERPARLPRSAFSLGGRVIDEFDVVFEAFGLSNLDRAAPSLPELVNRGVNKADPGAIQDPAGSAVGAGALMGGGVSGAIYKRFPDLKPIPEMPLCAAVFNASTGPGRRVLHTHAPQLRGDPADEDARIDALVALARSYANALLAFAERAPQLRPDGDVLNLVPVSSSIFAGQFKNGRSGFKAPHLDPTYTLAAVVVAMAIVDSTGTAIPPMTLNYFEADVYRAAVAARQRLSLLGSG